MQYVISFLEGIITFISPCLLPMLPIYISYFAGGGEGSVKRTLTCAAGFVLGFTAVFTAMGALAGTVGGFLREYQTAVNIVSGLIVVFFGLNFLGVCKINLSLGLGIPFLLSAALIGYLKSTFDWIKGHYGLINLISGGLLILIGLLMATGILGRLLDLLS